MPSEAGQQGHGHMLQSETADLVSSFSAGSTSEPPEEPGTKHASHILQAYMAEMGPFQRGWQWNGLLLPGGPTTFASGCRTSKTSDSVQGTLGP